MKIVMLNGQNHNGSTYHIGRMIADKIEGENEITEFFFPKDLNHFCRKRTRRKKQCEFFSHCKF